MKLAAHSKLKPSLYVLAKEFLHDELRQQGFQPDVLNSYICNPDPPKTLNDIYKQLLISAQNAHMRAGVISGSLGGNIDRLGKVLFDFNVNKVISHYATHEQLLDEIQLKLKPNGKILRNPRSIWPQYCRTILSAAKFMAQFKSLDEFNEWADLFCTNPKAFMAAPMMLAQEIHGIGFALACDFLKDLGYTKLGKPDIHIRDIFAALGISNAGDTDYEVLKTLTLLAEEIGVTAYNADKIFWLIGSGKFYLHPEFSLPRNHKQRFINFAKSCLA